MHGENNIFVRYLRTQPAPWHHKVHNPGSNHRQDVIVDYNSREICTLAAFTPAVTGEQYRRTIDLIVAAPELLAACIEFAFLQDQHGTLTPELADLISRAGGPDLSQRVSPTAPKVSAPATRVHTVNQKDDVSQTKTKKGRPLQR